PDGIDADTPRPRLGSDHGRKAGAQLFQRSRALRPALFIDHLDHADGEALFPTAGRSDDEVGMGEAPVGMGQLQQLDRFLVRETHFSDPGNRLSSNAVMVAATSVIPKEASITAIRSGSVFANA